MTCPFCDRIRQAVKDGRRAVAFLDAFPVSAGHTLVMPTRHEPDLFALNAEEQQAVWTLVAQEHERLVEQLAPDGFNVGINVGAAAGQTVPHAHVHLIPRHAGDVPDPRGGIRWVLPDRAAYWTT